MSAKTKDSCLNCDYGRARGCRTYCCQLLIRLSEADAKRLYPERPEMRFIEKDADGYCVHLDRETYGCKIWKERPEVCRQFNCNKDFMLQIAVTEGFTSIVELSKRAQSVYLPRHLWVTIPQQGE